MVERADFRGAKIRWKADPERTEARPGVLTGGWIHILERGDVVRSYPASDAMEVVWPPNAMPAVAARV